jgi:hypothetical protein
MPNFCENELTISGPDVERVLAAIADPSSDDPDEHILDFDQIVPYPQDLKDLDQRNAEYQAKFFAIAKDDPQRDEKLKALADEYGVEPGTPWLKDGYNAGGYEWCIQNWSTKWNACRVSLTKRPANLPLAETATCEHCRMAHKTAALEVLACPLRRAAAGHAPHRGLHQIRDRLESAGSGHPETGRDVPGPHLRSVLLRRRGRLLRPGALVWRAGAIPPSNRLQRPARRLIFQGATPMSYQSEHKRLKPVLDLARRLDIATNPDPTALFEAGNAGFQVWCTPDDHPKGWEGVEMIAGTFSKPCEYLGSVHWKWEGEQITALEISTTAYALADHKPGDTAEQAELPPAQNAAPSTTAMPTSTG